MTSPATARPFIHRFGERGGVVAQLFYEAARSEVAPGLSAPELLLAVTSLVKRRLKDPLLEVERATELRRVVAALQEDPSEALLFCAEVVRREQQDPEERAKEQRERRETHRKAWMASQPPTERQLRYLASLGREEAPPNRLAASMLIDRILQADPKLRGPK